MSTISLTELVPDLTPGDHYLAERDSIFQALAELTNQLPDTDGVPLETPWHLAAIALLIEILSHRWRKRDDFFVGGNTFIYYNIDRRRDIDFRGPDFFCVSGGVDRYKPRRFWAVWDENGRYPDLIVEFLSPSTAETDRTVKKALYERTFRTREYLCYDPETQQFEGWRLGKDGYEPIIANEAGRLWCEVLGLWIGAWSGSHLGQDGTWPRLFEPDGRLVLRPAEEAMQLADASHARAQAQEVRADAERVRAQSEQARAEAQQTRSEAAEAELLRMTTELAELRQRISTTENK